jgi:hypothetical protein
MVFEVQPHYDGETAKEYYFDHEDPIVNVLNTGRFDKLTTA